MAANRGARHGRTRTNIDDTSRQLSQNEEIKMGPAGGKDAIEATPKNKIGNTKMGRQTRENRALVCWYAFLQCARAQARLFHTSAASPLSFASSAAAY